MRNVNHFLRLLIVTVVATGCSTLNFDGSAERWEENRQRQNCQENFPVPCPRENG